MVSHKTTSLGLPEPVERAGAYLFLFLSGLFLLATERNATVRHHARQSIAVSIFIFAPLFVLFLLFSFTGGVLGWIPLIGWILKAPFALLAAVDKLAAIVIWVGLMVFAGFSDRQFQVPGAQRMKKLIG
jgi:uncharacterized membrane protein